MWTFARQVETFVRREPYDVVYGLGKTWTHDVLRLGGGCQATYLEKAHDATLTELERRRRKGAWKHRLALRIEARALAPGAYARVITNSDMVKRDVMRRHGVRPDAVQTIYNGVDLERFHPRNRSTSGKALRRALGFSSRERIVLFLGTGYGRKGLDLLLDAFPGVHRRDANTRLVVVGFDSARGRYEARARELGIEDATRFLGGRTDAEACYGAADLYVLPTRYDPFANSTLEALASGLPVVTSSTNGGAELIEPGHQGDVVELQQGADALEAALIPWCDPERAAAGSSAARELAQRHGAPSKLAQTEALLESVAAELAHARAR